MAQQIHLVFVLCKCGRLVDCRVVMPGSLNPLDSDQPVAEGVASCRCVCGRSATVRMTLEATPNQAWATEGQR